jgi:hypothetical protein
MHYKSESKPFDLEDVTRLYGFSIEEVITHLGKPAQIRTGKEFGYLTYPITHTSGELGLMLLPIPMPVGYRTEEWDFCLLLEFDSTGELFRFDVKDYDSECKYALPPDVR